MSKTEIQFSKQINSISFTVDVTPYRLLDNFSIPDLLRDKLEKVLTTGIKISFFEEGNPIAVSVHEININALEKKIV